jgi:hypothetical protein
VLEVRVTSVALASALSSYSKNNAGFAHPVRRTVSYSEEKNSRSWA